MTDTLVVLTKLPRIGAGKSRLAKELGRVQAWRINRALQARTFRRLADPRWRIVLAVTPRAALTQRLPGVWPPSARRLLQAHGDLGARLAAALGGFRGSVAIVGTDCPDVSRAAAAAVFALLRRRPVAIGPADDGGFWMLAMRRGAFAAPLRRGVRWSSPHTLADARSRLRPSALGPTLSDIDTYDDWKRWRRSASQRSSA